VARLESGARRGGRSRAPAVSGAAGRGRGADEAGSQAGVARWQGTVESSWTKPDGTDAAAAVPPAKSQKPALQQRKPAALPQAPSNKQWCPRAAAQQRMGKTAPSVLNPTGPTRANQGKIQIKKRTAVQITSATADEPRA
jgi:hypothetical protein